ncbi:ABC transporter ATP-binding protein [Fimbriimonas ginsengisoli]|uniref:Lipid A export ATP-binding/permease protein MsbA n=1 Tax=Fimbriimonas ginsengisoli Gsoil 348 TaxID=661478 RepID=A0A068NJX9_FIMGI|nr:ABC transporter ATP-binding protein [Fimbriimonas ginsengisoli]AIE83898.1 Lipid A export ATP-binding/permease protein MsbA [Fimbriimonas ginsengisoli Gsoil 348]
MARSEEPEERGAGGQGPNPLRRLLPELKPFRRSMALCVFLTIAQSVFGFLPPFVLGDIVNRLQRGEHINTVLYLVMIVSLAGAQALLAYALAVSMSSLGQRFLLHIRERMLAHMQSLPIAYFEKNQTGKLVSNVINDATSVQQLITGNLTTMMGDFVQLVLVIVVLFSINPVMALLSLGVAPVYILSFRHFYKPLVQTSDKIRARRDSMYGQMQEKLAGIQTVKGFGQERWEARSFMVTTRELMGLNVHQGALGGALWTVADALCGVATGLVLLYGGRLCLEGKMEAGTLVMFLLYAVTYVYGPIVRFLVSLDPIARTQAALERIFRTLDTKNEVLDLPGALPMPKIRGEVRFEDVWFEYEPGQPVLKGIDFTVNPGEMVALVGFSGSGKTTLASLLLRHYDPTSGRIMLDDIDLRDTQISSYRSQVGVVAQESILFNTTIRENIRYGRMEATDEEVEEAARAASIHDAIAALPDGYETRIGEEGIKLSVGEKQRVAIARALLADPRILILDEATSSLDSQTEALLQAALDNLMAGRTSFVIAHRLSTIVKAEKIVVLERGIVTEIGTHRQLLRNEGLYSRLYNEQFRVALQAAS